MQWRWVLLGLILGVMVLGTGVVADREPQGWPRAYHTGQTPRCELWRWPSEAWAAMNLPYPEVPEDGVSFLWQDLESGASGVAIGDGRTFWLGQRSGPVPPCTPGTIRIWGVGFEYTDKDVN